MGLIIFDSEKDGWSNDDVIRLKVTESGANKGCLLLVATTRDRREFVVSGDSNSPTYLVSAEKAFDLTYNQEL